MKPGDKWHKPWFRILFFFSDVLLQINSGESTGQKPVSTSKKKTFPWINHARAERNFEVRTASEDVSDSWFL